MGKGRNCILCFFGYGHANNGNSTMFLYSAPSQQPCLCAIHERYKISCDNNQMKEATNTFLSTFVLSTPENFDQVTAK